MKHLDDKVEIDYKEYSTKLLKLANIYSLSDNFILADYYMSRIYAAKELMSMGEKVNFFYDRKNKVYFHEVQYFDK